MSPIEQMEAPRYQDRKLLNARREVRRFSDSGAVAFADPAGGVDDVLASSMFRGGTR
jgi:hypothetical protein